MKLVSGEENMLLSNVSNKFVGLKTLQTNFGFDSFEKKKIE